MQFSTYHIILRVSALTLAIVLLFVSGIVTPVTKELSKNTGSYLAGAIGIEVAVAPTELNTVTAELTQRKTALDKRESDISAREIAVDLKSEQKSVDFSTFILSVILFVLLVLIVLNYWLDYIRNKQPIAVKTA